MALAPIGCATVLKSLRYSAYSEIYRESFEIAHQRRNMGQQAQGVAAEFPVRPNTEANS
jgi:hypothetical protein